jgi:hypothetical protein
MQMDPYLRSEVNKLLNYYIDRLKEEQDFNTKAEESRAQYLKIGGQLVAVTFCSHADLMQGSLPLQRTALVLSRLVSVHLFCTHPAQKDP